MLQPHQRELHLLLPEEGLDPLQQAVDHAQHVVECVCVFVCGRLDCFKTLLQSEIE